jgi:hypothetical protein
MGGVIVKASPGEDVYLEWSTVVEAPTFIGTRAEILEYLRWSSVKSVTDSPEERLARADETGSSSAGDYAWFASWDDDGFVVERRGILPRSKLRDFALLYAAEDRRWLDLLEPFDADTPVRRH